MFVQMKGQLPLMCSNQLGPVFMSVHRIFGIEELFDCRHGQRESQEVAGWARFDCAGIHVLVQPFADQIG